MRTRTRTRPRRFAAALAVPLVLAALAMMTSPWTATADTAPSAAAGHAGGGDAAHGAGAGASTDHDGGAATATHADPAAEPDSVNEAHQRFQPGYLRGRVVVYEPSFDPVPDDAEAADLFEVEYPAEWWTSTARPLCSFCDHNMDGKNAWDFHDHVLSRTPGRKENAADEVYWTVRHVQPAYTGDPAVDAEITAAYGAALPATTVRAVRSLLGLETADGDPVARVIETGFVFAGPVRSMPR